ncbi:MAG: molybdopterin-dependent oxidoreductase [Enterocloster bolteae]
MQCHGLRAYSNTAVFFGGGDFTNPARRARISQVLGVDESMLAAKPTAAYNQIIEGINEGRIKGLWILCTNPRHSWTNNETFASAVKKLELFVVQDIYDSIESAEECTVFFPVVPGIKRKEPTLIWNAVSRPCVPVCPEGNMRLSDYEAILGVGRALGMGDMLKGWETPRDCFGLMKECSRGMPCDITGVTWEGLENSHGIQWPLREGESPKEDERRLYEDGKFYTPSGKARFQFQSPVKNPLPLTEEFPYMFNTGRGSVGQWHTQSRTKEVQFVEDVSAAEAYLFMNPRTASAAAY